LKPPTRSGAILSALVLAGTSFFSGGCIDSEIAAAETGRAPNSGYAHREGMRLYQHNCAPCHGQRGEGDGRYYASSLGVALPDFSDRERMAATDDATLIEAITSTAGGCPPWGDTFTQEEMEYMLVAIRSFVDEGEQE
jgi:mono/diheme cytochrome c family protein